VCWQVKLEPSDIEAWNALGHCFWKKGDLQGALNCYQEALQKVGGVQGDTDIIRRRLTIHMPLVHLRQCPSVSLSCWGTWWLQRANKDSLRQLSMVLRQLPAKTYAEAQKNVQVHTHIYT
jgi:tetratricopeptide (TPR) repeat protein